MAKYLNENGVSYLWSKMTDYVTQQGTSGSSNPLKYYSQEFTSNGTFTVPENVYTIFITACGGGGGGGGVNRPSRNVEYFNLGQGGGGAEAIVRKPFSVIPSTEISITLGLGGNAGNYTNYNSLDDTESYGTDGTSTVIGSLITLLGGYGGKYGNEFITPARNGGGYGGITGVKYRESDRFDTPYITSGNGGDGILGKGGVSLSTFLESNPYIYGGGGGGGSLGNGGDGAFYGTDGTAGVRGGGGGGAHYNSGFISGGSGGDGYVLIEWWVK